MTARPLDRFLSLVCREMHADDARVLGADRQESDAPNVLHARLPDGRLLAVVFAEPPAKKDALKRRLEMLLRTFAQSLEAPVSERRLPPARSLRDELVVLVNRARAVDAVVIDANSPIVWGSASPRPDAAPSADPAISLIDVSKAGLGRLDKGDLEQDGDAPESRDEAVPPAGSASRDELTEKAVAAVRALPAIATLRKGGHLHHVLRTAELSLAAHSFAAIYVLILVYDAPFDELRAERAVADALPRIERLVLALPPHDPRPAPTAGVMTLRRRRRH